MTTEQKLREALEKMLRECDTPDHLGPMVAPSEGACDFARAALALPPTQVRREWRYRYGDGVWQMESRRPCWLNRSGLTIQHRDVPEPGPWEDGE